MIPAKHFDTINEGTKILDKLKIKYPEISTIEALVSSYSDNMNGDELSQYICELSINLVRINDVAAQFISNSNESYTYRKFAQLWEFNALSNKMAVKEREQIALDNSFEFYKMELLNKYIADVIKAKIDSVNKLISSIQTRLRFVRAEQANSNTQT